MNDVDPGVRERRVLRDATAILSAIKTQRMMTRHINEQLQTWGPAIITYATGMLAISLRELARRTALSPTYLSMVKRGKATISAEAFEKVYDLTREKL